MHAHVILGMLAYCVQRQPCRVLAPLLFDEDDPAQAAILRATPVTPAQRSASGKPKAATQRDADGPAGHRLPALLSDQAASPNAASSPSLKALPPSTSSPCPLHLQQHIFDLLGSGPNP